MNSETASQAVKNIKAGWNLGNTLDSCGKISGDYSAEKYETLWHSPVIRREMIEAVRDAGFSAVRFPVTWYPHIDDEGNIKGQWLDRAEEIASYILDAGMYCIINVHHDSGEHGWIRADEENFRTSSGKFAALWRNIALRFRDYDEKLMFEGFNEMLDAGSSWTEPLSDSSYDVHNRYNQLFVDVVRETGGNNYFRNLSVQTYSAGESQRTLDNFVLPSDISEGHIIAQVHNYDPQGFCWLKAKDRQMRDSWGTAEDMAEADRLIARLGRFSERIDAPVIIGEYGSQHKDNEAYRAAHAAYFTSSAAKTGIKCFWWDTQGSFGLLDRANSRMMYESIVKAITFN